MKPSQVQPLALDELAAERGHKLPNEHPHQPQDGICVSARARDQIVAQKAPEINPISFWDHETRTAPIGARRLTIDPASSYRLE
ncbi:MAG: hypothetical protein ACREMT_00255 [Vulcanimicrobiaceae bacterium]